MTADALPNPTDDPLPIPPDDPNAHLSAHLPPASPGRRWRQLDRLVVVVFCLGLLVPGALLAVGRHSAEIENRPLYKLPAMNFGSLFDTKWYSAIDRYLSDNIAVRPIAVRLRGETYWRLGGTGNDAVVRGLGSWLFTREEIQPECDLSAADVAAALDRTNAAFTAAGQQFRFIVAPDKHVIYPEKLDPAMPFGPLCTDGQRAAMEAAIRQRSTFAVDGWSAVLTARAADPNGPLLYYTQDSHWTPTGALAGIHALIDSLQPGLWSDADIGPGHPKHVAMELARQMGLSRGETVPGPQVRPGVQLVRTSIDMPIRTTGAKAVYRVTASGDRPTIPGVTVIVYDSFFGLNIPSIAPFFAESIWIHEGDLLNHPDIAKYIGPVDRVVLERVERGLYFTRIDDLLRPLVRTGG
jgi:hypothetical protein